ncbi:MAG: PAS domain-containing protein, partial [Geminicoccaceae bacterium]
MPNEETSTSTPVSERSPAAGGRWQFPARHDARTVAAMAGLFAGALLLIAATVYIGSVRQDAAQREHEQLIVSASLKSLKRHIASNAIDYAHWDDAVEHLVLTLDTEWADRNVGANLNDSLGYEQSLVLDRNNSPTYGQVNGAVDTAAARRAFGSLLQSSIDAARRSIEIGQDSTSAVLAGPQGLVLTTVAAIEPEPESVLQLPAGPPFLLLLGKRLDRAFLREVEDDFDLTGLAFLPAGDVSQDLAKVDLLGFDQQVVAHIAWPPRRPGREQLAWLLPALAGSLLAIGLFASLALHRMRFASALRRSEARLRDFADVSSDWLWETDDQLRFSWLSPSSAESGGLAQEKVMGRRRDELGGSALSDGGWEAHHATLAAQQPFRGFTYSLLDDHGQQRIVRINGTPIHDSQGRFRGYRGTGRNVTEEWEAAQRLRESENRFRSLVENLRGIIFIRGVAGSGPFGYDERGVQIFGADAMELAGAVETAAWYGLVHPDDLPGYLEAERRRKEHGEPYSMEYRVTHARTKEERWMRETGWVVEAPEEGRRYLDSYIIDVTEQKRATLALQDSEVRLQLALAAGGMGTWDVDLLTGVEHWNDVHYRLFGVDPASFTPSSASFSAMVDPRDLDSIDTLAADVLAGRHEPAFTNDYRIVRPDGTTRWIGGVGRLLRDAG